MENYDGYLSVLRWSLRQQGDETGPSGGEPTRRLTDEVGEGPGRGVDCSLALLTPTGRRTRSSS